MTDIDRMLAAHDLETALLGGRPHCDLEPDDMCAACGHCNCDRHDNRDRPADAELQETCPGVGEYGRGLTGKTVHWGCCPASR